ncbi:MAG: Hsp20/alpha crystallin family protein [Candidatus Doudnabacteria bacterium]
MPRQKQSFFGKIMGGDVTDQADIYETESDEMVDQDEMEYEEELVDDDELTDEESDEYEYDEEEYEAESDDDEEEEYEPQDRIPAEPQTAPIQSPISQEDEDWMSEYEGALNIDMYQTKDNVIIKSTIAGVRPDDIDITVANDMVTIKGSRQREEKVVDDDYIYQECYWGGFSRSVIVPVDIDSEKIEADLKDGILTIIIPKAAKAKTKKVKVKGF